MRRFPRIPAALTTTIAAIVIAAAAPGGAGAATNARALAHDVLAGLSNAHGTKANPSSRMQVALALSRPKATSEQQLYKQIYDPKSRLYHHFLSPRQFNAAFGVSKKKYKAARAWMRAGGLKLGKSSGRDYILATGTVAQIERRFHVTIKSYTVGRTTFLANTAAPRVPASIPALSVLGLNTLQRFSTPTRPKTAAPVPALVKAAGLPNIFTTTPQSLWSVYDQPAAHTGAGQSIAVFGEGDSSGPIADLKKFEDEYKLPHTPVTVNDVGPGPFTDTSGAEEWDIDTQASSGMAPNASGLTLYFGNSLVDATVANLFATWVNDPNGPKQANASFGECEQTPIDPVLLQAPGDISQDPTASVGLALGDNLEAVGDQILLQATLEGRTLFSSTGDTGGSCPVLILGPLGAGNGVLNQGLPLLNYPSASPYATAVGGTVLYTAGTTPDSRFLEYGWTFGGGGSSPFITAPAYQQGVSNIVGRCLTDPTGQPTNTGQLCRSTPDVSAQSGDVLSNGYAIVADGQDSEGGGTSLSSPLWAGMWARVQGTAPAAGYGFANETIYRLAKSSTDYARDFTDITLGTNGQQVAQTGWDAVTGWGPPKLANLIADAGH